MTNEQQSPSPLGREQELDELRRLLGTAHGGRPLLAVVAGPAGIGKTSLVEYFLARLDDVAVHRARGVPWESRTEFGLAEQLARATGESAVLPRFPDGTPDPVGAGEQLLLRWSAQPDTPVVAVVDDAHWSDIDSLRALSSAFRRMVHERVLILLMHTDDPPSEGCEQAREFLTGHRGHTVRPAALTVSQVRSLAIRHSGIDLSGPAARGLAEHTHGNPLHIGNLLDELPAEVWREWQPALPAPREFGESITRTLHACEPPTRALVESAAALGTSVSLSEATTLAAVDNPVRALDEACRAGLLSIGPGRGLGRLAFPNPLLHAAVYSGLPPLRRQELHQRAAEISDDEAARLRHRVACTPFTDADLASELDEFAFRQAALGAWSAAGEALVNASRLSPERTARESRLLRAVDALVGAGDLAQAGAFTPVIESFPPSALRDAVLGYLAILLGRPGEAEMLLDRAWKQCDQDTAPQTAALVCQRRVLHSLSRLRGSELVAWAESAVRLTSDPQAPSAVESQAIMGLGLAAAGRTSRARAAYREVSAKVSAGAQLQRVQMGKGWLDLALDNPETARRELESAAPTEYRRGSTRISLWSQAWLARAQFVLGAWDEAVHTVDRAAVALESTGMELMRPLVHWTGAQLHALRGNREAAGEHLRQAAVATHAYEIMLVPACLARAQYAEVRADYEAVVRNLEPLLRLQSREAIDEPGLWPWQDVYANALVMTDQPEEADRFLRPHEALAAERGHRSTMARLGYVRGRIAGSKGDIDSARNSFDDALARLEGLPLPYERARVNFAYGQTLRRAGKRREADAVLHSAREAYTALGAISYVERCDRELKAGGLNARRGDLDLSGLTAQERAVAELVAAGMSNKQAAVELFISVKTVQFHLTRVYGKLGIRSRGELAARFHEKSSEEA